MKLTFIEQPEFSAVRDELFGTEQGSSFRNFQYALMRDPRAGDVIPGTSGRLACDLPSLMDFEAHSHLVAFLKIFCFANACFDGHNVAAIFGKQ